MPLIKIDFFEVIGVSGIKLPFLIKLGEAPVSIRNAAPGLTDPSVKVTEGFATLSPDRVVPTRYVGSRVALLPCSPDGLILAEVPLEVRP